MPAPRALFECLDTLPLPALASGPDGWFPFSGELTSLPVRMPVSGIRNILSHVLSSTDEARQEAEKRTMTDRGLHEDATAGRAKGGAVTVSQAFGEIVWLIGQSPLHRNLRVADLDWLVMPAVLHKQFHLFREGTRPVGVALWAKVDGEGERKLIEGLLQGGNQLSEPEWAAGDRLWLVDLIAPFATNANRHREVMFGDLLAGRLNGRAFKMPQTDPATGDNRVIEVPANAGAQLVEILNKILGEAEQ